MLGHYLLTLNPTQEHDVLTTPFGPLCSLARRTHGHDRCLMMVTNPKAGKIQACFIGLRPLNGRHFITPAGAYENLCRRFGYQRINAAIRTRILSNIAHRMPARELVDA